ncbi:eukaryotic type KH-domain (KH-domain type I) [Xylariaceae sp. FL1651]|nr:eukaryotic type KH-domain (KH-domain type I) [Xylariaceae sp. FL1651]
MPSHKLSRWGQGDSDVANITNLQLPTAITTPMTSEQLDAYVLHVRIEEITQTLRLNNTVTDNQSRRSPSPEPQYDNSGRRTNTRPQRYRQRLEEERHALIHTAMDTIPNYRMPAGYIPQTMIKKKVYVPVKEFPEVSFIGQLLGPRGRSLAQLSEKAGANIVIRGKGSVKEGKRGRRDNNKKNKTDDDEHEPLHCLITAGTREKMDKASEMLQDVIATIVTTPDTNDRKRQQLRDLAVLNGTFRDDEGRAGRADGDLRYERQGVAAHVRCHFCGGGGHIARDCTVRRTSCTNVSLPPWRRNGNQQVPGSLEMEYQQLLSEI